MLEAGDDPAVGGMPDSRRGFLTMGDKKHTAVTEKQGKIQIFPAKHRIYIINHHKPVSFRQFTDQSGDIIPPFLFGEHHCIQEQIQFPVKQKTDDSRFVDKYGPSRQGLFIIGIHVQDLFRNTRACKNWR